MDFEAMLGRDYLSLRGEDSFPEPRDEEEIEGVTYIDFPCHGAALVVDERGIVDAVQFHGEPAEDMACFTGSLPASLRFDMGREEARAILGTPPQSGEERESSFLGRKPAWDKWRIGHASVHAEYCFGAKAIRLVSLAA